MGVYESTGELRLLARGATDVGGRRKEVKTEAGQRSRK